MTGQRPDDVDRLFARLERAPAPADLTARVLASTVGRRTGRKVVWRWCVAGVLGVLGLAVAGYLVGASLATSDGVDLLLGLAADLSLLTAAPGDVLAALGEIVPWPLLGLAVSSAGLLAWVWGRALPALARR